VLDVPGLWSPIRDDLAFADADSLSILPFEGNVHEKRLVFRSSQSENIGDIAWNPDGTRLAFLMSRRVWRVNVDGSDAQALFSATGHDSLGIRG